MNVDPIIWEKMRLIDNYADSQKVTIGEFIGSLQHIRWYRLHSFDEIYNRHAGNEIRALDDLFTASVLRDYHIINAATRAMNPGHRAVQMDDSVTTLDLVFDLSP